MVHKLGVLLLAAGLALVPASAGAYSFGTFEAGEQIVQITLSASGANGVTYTPHATDPAAGTVVIQASLSGIVTNLDSYNITLGDVLLDITLTMEAGKLLILGGSNPSILFGLEGGLVAADVTITDLGDPLPVVLLTGDFLGILDPTKFEFSLTDSVVLGVKSSISSEFSSTGGDDAFADAFTSGGDLLLNLTGFGVSDICQLTSFGICGLPGPIGGGPNDLNAFSANPNGTLTPLLTPEPGTFSLLGLGMIGLAALRRHR